MRSGAGDSGHSFIGVDVGTSGLRTIAINAAGNILAEDAQPLPAPARAGACVEQDPAIWWHALLSGLRAITPTLKTYPPTRLAIDGTSGTLLLADSTGAPLGPALMYNDARATAQAREIAQYAQTTSGAIGAGASLAKLVWLVRHTDTHQARHALHQADWLAARLTGHYGSSDYHNCLKLGLDVQTLEWPTWMTALGIDPDLLPNSLTPGETLGPIDPALAASLELPHDLVICAGTTDSIAAFLATGANMPGEAVSSLGSTLALKLLCETPIFDIECGVYSHKLGRYWLAGGASNTGGAVLRKYFSDEEIASLSLSLKPTQPTGLNYYPLCEAGERFPINDPAHAPRLSPIPDDRAQFFQGLLEGIAAIEQAGYARLAALGGSVLKRVYSAGGGAANAPWRAMREALLGAPVMQAAHDEAAYGAACLARDGLGGFD